MTKREALAELVAMYDDPAKRDPEWHLRYGRVWAAAREALAQPAPEPVAWVDERAISWLFSHRDKMGASITTKLEPRKSFERPMPLYAAPPPPAPAPAQPAPEPEPATFHRASQWGRLYTAAAALCAKIGADGDVESDHHTVDTLMDAMHDLDGGEWMPGLMPSAAPPPPAPEQPAQFSGTHPTDPDYDHSEAYLRAQPEQPALSDEQIDFLWQSTSGYPLTRDVMREFARAIERALSGQP